MTESLTTTLQVLRHLGVLEPVLPTCSLFRQVGPEEQAEVIEGGEVIGHARGDMILDDGAAPVSRY